ncbi:hypothetical protein [Chitinilyticum aquatile]|uniref:hypothetical protein n=1 Tax=Chitinilyticum aquatile TaxID=362520 RepID=UPI00041E268D|nr:hypothetical protein [Chitinilyticum aquatile]
MFGKIFGVKCPRCGARNNSDADVCEKCGITTALNRLAILQDNRWEAAPDELAVFFKAKDLEGIFSRKLEVPSGMRAWILQDNKVSEVPEGEYTLENFFTRINTLFRGKHSEILITRQGALELPFRFDDILSAEFLRVAVQTSIYIRVGNVDAFRNHFMLRAGAVTAEQLVDLLSGSVRQVFAEAIGTRRLEEIMKQGDLRAEIDTRLLTELSARFNDMGLAFDRADTLSLRHEKYLENQQEAGTLWLQYDQARVKATHQAQLNQLYNEQEWQKIHEEEEAMRRRYRCGELTQEEAELAQVIRLRELDLYEKISNAKTRKEAIDLAGRDQIEVLESTYNSKRHQRERDLLKQDWQEEDEEASWQHTRELAQITRRTEVDLRAAQGLEATRLEAERIAHALEKIRIQNTLEQAGLIADAAEQEEAKQLANAQKQAAALREQEIIEAHHQVALDDIYLSREARRCEASRVQTWEDALLEDKLATLKRAAKQADENSVIDIATKTADARMQGLEALMGLEHKLRLEEAEKQLQLEAAANKAKQEQLDAEFARKRIELADERAHTLQMEEQKLEYLRTIGSLPPYVLLAQQTDPLIIEALSGLAKMNALSSLDKEQAEVATRILNARPVNEAQPQVTVNVDNKPLEDAVSALTAANERTIRVYEDTIARSDRSKEQEAANLLELAKHALNKNTETALGTAQAQQSPQIVVQATAQPFPQYATATATATAPAPLASSQPIVFKQCPGCGRNCEQSGRFCSGCGKSLN